MSSRFVSGGKIDTQTGDVVPSSSGAAGGPGSLPAAPLPALAASSRYNTKSVSAAVPGSNGRTSPSTKTSAEGTGTTRRRNGREEEWAAVQAQVDAERGGRRGESSWAGAPTAGPASAAGGGVGVGVGGVSGGTVGAVGVGGGTATTKDTRSLYEVLQANKAAKQAAFEEANRIKNQFRALDEDEVAFLAEVRERKREEEERERREVEEGLRAFRRARGGGEGGEMEEKEEEEGGEGEGEGEVEGVEDVVTEGFYVGQKRKKKKRGREETKIREEEEEAEADEREKKKRVKGGGGGLLKGIKRTGATTSTSTTTTMTNDGGDGEKAEEGTTMSSTKGGTASTSTTSTSAAAGGGGGAGVAPPERSGELEEAKPTKKLLGGLVDYGSDEDSD